MSKYNLTELAEGMGYKEYEDAKEADRLEAHPDKEMIKKVQAMMAKEKTLKEDEDLEQAKKDAIEKLTDFSERSAANVKIFMDALMKYDIGSPEVKKAQLASEKGIEALGKEINYSGELSLPGMKEVMGVDRKGNEQPDTDGSDATKYKKAAMKEEADPIEAEMKMHLKQYNAGNIDGNDLAKAFDEILNGRISPPGERGFNTKYGMEESYGVTDQDPEDDVVNVDKVSSPSAKGTGYGAETSSNDNEDNQEDKEIANPKPMYTEMDLSYTELTDDEKDGVGDMMNNIYSKINPEGDMKKNTGLFKYIDAWFESKGDSLSRGKLNENGDVDDFADEIAEADPIPTEKGITKMGDDGKEYGVRASNHDRKMAMRNVIDILRDELSVNTSDAFDYIRTHKDDLFNGEVDAYDKDEVIADYKEYESVNVDSVEEMESLREHFNRFM